MSKNRNLANLISSSATPLEDLIASAPSALNTLDELAAALNDDANFATTVTNSLATKAPLASPTFTGDAVFNSNTALTLPSGSTIQRPSSPTVGMTRYNTTTGFYEFYNGSTWASLSLPYTIEYLIIGGGGSGGVYSSGSGYASGNPGSSSSFGAYSSSGGGAGTAYSASVTYRDGGSGGGGGSSGGDNNTGGSGVTGQGYSGGNGQYSSGVYQGGGGGGAGVAGGSASGTTAGSGGNGISSSITGSSITRAGGGGGGVFGGGGVGGAGGSGGGGAGNGNGYISGVNGTINTGSGGGAGNTVGAGHGGGGAGGYRCSVIGESSGRNSSSEPVVMLTPGSSYTVVVGAGGSAVGVSTVSGQGGSGIVVIRYAGAQRATGGSITSSGGYTIHTFTSSGTFTA